MRQPDSHGIPEQQASYRRGLVMGLTMAEVGILIIFVLLLLLAFNEWIRERDQIARQAFANVPKEKLESLERSDAIVKNFAQAVGAGPNAPPEEIEKLVRVIQAVAQKPQGQTMLAKAKEEINRLSEARRRIEKIATEAKLADGLTLAGQIERQSFELANKEGQLKRYETQLQEAGLGKGERPCWVTPDGTIEYLFEVALTSDGIRMRELQYAGRAGERSTLPIPETNPSEVLSPGEFQRRTAPLYTHSLEQNCRFFVVVYDATQSTEKDLYKKLLRTVEGHFYKRLDQSATPF